MADEFDTFARQSMPDLDGMAREMVRAGKMRVRDTTSEQYPTDLSPTEVARLKNGTTEDRALAREERWLKMHPSVGSGELVDKPEVTMPAEWERVGREIEARTDGRSTVFMGANNKLVISTREEDGSTTREVVGRPVPADPLR